jgi:tetratricopeptide (TPR) repeat protein
MKKFLTSLAMVFAMVFAANAQSGEYEDLLKLFVDEKYDKVILKATKYTETDATKKDPLPYLFISMSYFELSKDDKMKEKFPDAFKLSLKYIKSYSAKDKDKKYGAEYEDFFGELRTAIINEGELMLDQQKYTKAKGMYTYLIAMDAKDAGAQIYMGIVLSAMKVKKESEAALTKATELITSKACTVSTKEQKNLLKNALITYASMLSDAGNKALAKDWLESGSEFFTEDKEYQITLESVSE